MSLAYGAVGWNRQKIIYDLIVLLGIAAYLSVFALVNLSLYPDVTAETIVIRGFGSAALILLHLILVIGPLSRLNKRFLPLLYNRRHLGVIMFFLALVHAGMAILQFHAFGDMNPIASILASNTNVGSVASFPFQPLGLLALMILFLMAATSHDFWLANLTPPVWKALHMSVYGAYLLLLGHVVLGVLQAERSPLLASLLGIGLVVVITLHLIAGFRNMDREWTTGTEFVDICCVDDIPENRAKIVFLSGERVAVFHYDNKISAVSNVCRHQNGPLGEGKIIDGCITCPWHGFQYRPADGASPPPFTEKVPTFPVMVVGDRVLVSPIPNKPGTYVEPANVAESAS